MNQLIIPTGGAGLMMPGAQVISAGAAEETPTRLYQWLDGINDGVSIHSACNGVDEESLVDGDTGTEWLHNVDEDHWIIFDLGTRYYVEKVRIFKTTAATEYDWNDCNIQLSHSPVNLGSVVAGPLDFTSMGIGWIEATAGIDASGRYLKMAFGSYHSIDYVQTGEIQFYV